MIRYREAFQRKPSAQFDGEWDWDFLEGAFPRGIMPMDFDGTVEIGGHFLIFETKDPGREVSAGQMMALKRQTLLDDRSLVLILWGKKGTEEFNCVRNGELRWDRPQPTDDQQIFRICKEWADWADANPRRGTK